MQPLWLLSHRCFFVWGSKPGIFLLSTSASLLFSSSHGSKPSFFPFSPSEMAFESAENGKKKAKNGPFLNQPQFYGHWPGIGPFPAFFPCLLLFPNKFFYSIFGIEIWERGKQLFTVGWHGKKEEKRERDGKTRSLHSVVPFLAIFSHFFCFFFSKIEKIWKNWPWKVEKLV